ncbi:Glycosyltransferase, catalytic subunit of cellulose synthase and poly-beta-1,6-N-acetylglucosamine synthase [Actinomadura meyerae]|uniref:Glycosyltransferase, catalytic subunit of cellulose synthase and poly-beta-1,6-N-acetylglucosamine synthase n=1 Tax=Actinomadura meyerae TaxID=240840 RepID=A0A239N5P3_9ACTN|nr:bifunctional polysaccharide deacetylase/glycosyltransferase family 2 protein [Actinomadura meyerae]SNT49782.1 Glycosyltransferase, catalytic subunit of cellulose synthase and poly-beta-1,6-N-acetylglucosamine synthase [Actinomadura meyerae]
MRRGEPRGHWVLLLLGGLALSVLLLLDGFANGAVGEAPRDEPAHPAPAPSRALTGGPVLNLADATPRSRSMPPKTIALTFDDGPDPVWTPRILDVLRRHDARATFFTVGSRVAENPALTRRILREGHEIGSHTYTHADLATAPAWRGRLELDLTQRALAGAAGVHTRLMRMPYSSRPDGLTAPEWRAARRAGEDGYIVVLTDRDTEDWARPGTGAIVRTALAAERRGEGAVVMLHDSGGDRADTVAAVERILDRLQPEGYRFTTVTEALGMPSAEVAVPAYEKAAGWTLVVAQRAASALTGTMGAVFAAAGLLYVLRLLLLLVFAHVHMRRVRRPGPPAPPDFGEPGELPPDPFPPVSVVVPAYNEEAGIAATVASLLDTDYPGGVEVIVVDDGSSDRTAAIVEELGLPGVHLIRKANGGKPSALNAGLFVARADILVLVDGDTVFQRDTLRHLVAPFTDQRVGAVSGNTKVANRGGVLGRWQHIEYVIGFNLDRRMFDVLQCMPTVPGAIGAFRRRVLAEVGCVPDDTLAEDTDLTMAICRTGARVVYEEKAIAWTEAPSSLRQLWKQRYRWCYGTMQAMWKHRRSLIERGGSGRFGRRCLPYLTVFQVLLPLFAPAVDLFALFGMVFLDPTLPVLTWTAFVAAQAAAGAYALWLDGESIRPLWALPLQQFVYRQLMYLVVVQSVVTALLGSRLGWQTIRRTGTFSGGREQSWGPVGYT